MFYRKAAQRTRRGSDPSFSEGKDQVAVLRKKTEAGVSLYAHFPGNAAKASCLSRKQRFELHIRALSCLTFPSFSTLLLNIPLCGLGLSSMGMRA